MIWGNKPEKNERAVAELETFGGTVRCASVDVADEAAVKAGIALILGEFGRIDQAIANAGIGIARRDMFEISQADFDRLQSINVYGVFYTLREAAAHMIERAMAVELAPHGVRVNSILPGWTRSDMTERLQGWDKFNENVISRAPVGRWGDGDDFSAIAVYLASQHSSFHLGDAIVIDGGYTIY